MIETASPALHQALALMRAPRGPRPGPRERLPSGTLQLVRIAAGEEEATAEAQAATGLAGQTLRDAAIFYIQQVFFAPGSNSYRVLGADPDESDERLREHYRWLARWLHPDRNPDEWEVVYAERVNAAWQDLRTSERRARYQPAESEPDEWSAIIAAPPAHLFQPMEEVPAPPPKPRDLRWVPSAVVAILGSVALALVVLFYSSQRVDTNAPLAIAEPPPPSDEIPTRLAQPMSLNAGSVEATPSAATPAPKAISVASANTPPVRPTPEETKEPAPTLPSVPPPRTAAISSQADQPKPPSSRTAPMPKPVTSVAAPVAVAAADNSAKASSDSVSPSTDVATAPTEPAREIEGSRPGSRDANRLLGQLSRAYEDGDIQGMRLLFASDARGPNGGLNSILAEYRRVFADSSERSLSVRDVSCFVNGDTFTIVATFEANVVSESPTRTRRTRGDLRLDLRREGDRWQIFRMQHGERPG